MPIEATLTRALDIRFIDARTIATEAKLSLGICGYPSQHQEAMLVDEAIRIFEERSAEERCSMQRLRDHLEACKNTSHLLTAAQQQIDDDGEESSCESSVNTDKRSSVMLRMLSRRSR